MRSDDLRRVDDDLRTGNDYERSRFYYFVIQCKLTLTNLHKFVQIINPLISRTNGLFVLFLKTKFDPRGKVFRAQ